MRDETNAMRQGMSDGAAWRDRILSEPDVILDDPDVMRALVAANERALGSNVVDLRGIAMERLEARLDRLEDTHRSVIAAAYENLSGTNQVHRAVLRMLEAGDLDGFLRDLCGDVAAILRVDCARFVLEEGPTTPAFPALPCVSLRPEGFVDAYLTRGRGIPRRPVYLRQVGEGEAKLYGEAASWVRSEACLRLEAGADAPVCLLVLGAEDPHQFTPAQGTDLLTFFAGTAERALGRWLG